MDLDVNLPALSHLYGLSKSERNLDWNNLLPLEGSNARVAEKVVRKVLDRGYGWVYLWGEYGTAKSLILQIATSVSLQTGKEASYVRMAEILDHIRAGFNEGNASKRLDWWEAVPVLCVDEFERVHETDWAGEKRFVLMDNRYVSACRRESVTIIAGNADPSKLDGYLWDRINDGRFEIVKMTGESARPGMDWADKS
jgi:DNA replication protein DnaC